MTDPRCETAEGVRVGRKKIFEERMNTLFLAGTKARIDGVLAPGEERLAFIREAVDREIQRRIRATQRASPDVKKSSEG